MNVTTPRKFVVAGRAVIPAFEHARWAGSSPPGYSPVCNDFPRRATYLQNPHTMITSSSSRSNSEVALGLIEDVDDGRVMHAQETPAETTPDLPLEIAHLLLIDIVGYAKLLIDEQIQFLKELNQIVRSTECFRAAERIG